MKSKNVFPLQNKWLNSYLYLKNYGHSDLFITLQHSRKTKIKLFTFE